MKKTHREGWRVIVEIRPMATHTPISALGFEGLEGQLVGAQFEIEVAPRRLGDFGAVSMSDRLASRDVEGDYRRRCDELLAEMVKLPHVSGGRVLCEETHTCSHCGYDWEELTAEQAVDPESQLDEHSAEGEPVCCDKGIAEFRAARGIPQYQADVVAYRNPDRPGVLLCRRHGYGWAGLIPLTSEDLPDGGVCTFGDPADPSDQCARDVLIVEAGEAR